MAVVYPELSYASILGIIASGRCRVDPDTPTKSVSSRYHVYDGI